ncbi:MAG: threonine synthase [Bacteroidetes bacterium]|nr:threonine synthase [Bacteroidota bacterium]
MRLYSTNNRSKFVSLKEAVLKGLPEDNGLYMPSDIPKLSDAFFNNLKNLSFQQIAYEISYALFKDIIPKEDIQELVKNSITFPAPLVKLDESIYILELFHGPSLAFKDFGARFMAQLMSYFNKEEEQELVILVATSGDTGGAVASGFYKAPGIKVVILYPSGKVSALQEKQLTTLGHNISAIEVNGTFDDCQALVKKAFLDKNLNKKIRLSSANSINIARLIPQTFYYFEAYKQLEVTDRPVVFCVPSGNFGNLTAGLLAKRMGLKVDHFIAATNINDVVTEYLESGVFTPRPSLRTISNAMDVGNPSNFVRILDMYCSTWNNIRNDVSGYSSNDDETIRAIKDVYENYQYSLDPHGAVGYNALTSFFNSNKDRVGVILETAHPSKFIEVVEAVVGEKIDIPVRLSKLAKKEKVAVKMDADYSTFKQFLVERY